MICRAISAQILTTAKAWKMKLHRGKNKQMQEMEVNIEGGRQGENMNM